MSVALLTTSMLLARLKLMLNMRAAYVPRLNSYALVALGTRNTLTIVPLSEAVASSCPVVSKATTEIMLL